MNIFKKALLGLVLATLGVANARELGWTVYASPIGEYMIKVGPTLDESSGLMMEIAAGAFRKSNIKVGVAPAMPWARAQAEAMHQPGAILVLLAKTPAREEQWRWLSMVYTDKVYGVTNQGEPIYSSFDEMKAKSSRVAVKIGSASESLLRGMNIAVDTAPNEHRNLLKLFHDRVDVALLQGMVLYPAVQAMLQDRYGEGFRARVKDLRRTQIMDIPLWIVTSRKTPEAEAKKLRDALEYFKQTPEYRAIIKKPD